MTRSDRMRLMDILEAIRDINAHTASGRRAFDADRMAQQAVMHCLTVIGEATSRLTSTTLAYYPFTQHPRRGWAQEPCGARVLEGSTSTRYGRRSRTIYRAYPRKSNASRVLLIAVLQNEFDT